MESQSQSFLAWKPCPKCGTNFPLNARSCDLCGQKFRMSTDTKNALFVLWGFALLAAGALATAQIFYHTTLNTSYQLTMWLTIILFFANVGLFFLMFFCFSKLVYPAWRLLKRGARTKGLVLEREEKPKQSLPLAPAGSPFEYTALDWALEQEEKSRRVTSFVTFEAPTDPPVEYIAMVFGRYRANKHLSLLYDPRCPGKRVELDHKRSLQDLRGVLGLGNVCMILCAVPILFFVILGFWPL